jgi:hypothetical protein
MGQYSAKGLYAGYDKNNKERDALDYYATPPWEVENILREIQIEDLDESLIRSSAMHGFIGTKRRKSRTKNSFLKKI